MIKLIWYQGQGNVPLTKQVVFDAYTFALF